MLYDLIFGQDESFGKLFMAIGPLVMRLQLLKQCLESLLAYFENLFLALVTIYFIESNTLETKGVKFCEFLVVCDIYLGPFQSTFDIFMAKTMF